MKKLSLITIAIFFLSITASQEAFAHATPITYEPESASLLEKAPDRIRIHFSERIERKASGISIFGPDGSRADDESPTVDPNDARLYSVGVKDAGEGTYTVSWQVVSADDGHFTKGAFSFSVGIETAPAVSGQIQIRHITTLPQATAIGIEMVGQAMFIAALMALVFLWRPLKRKFAILNQHEAFFKKRFALFFLAGCALIFAGAASFFIIKTYDLGQLRAGSFFELFKIFATTVDGFHALLRGILGVIAAAIFLVFRKKVFGNQKISWPEFALLAVILVIMFSRALVSHAAASHFLPSFSIFVNFVHLFFKELWVGGIVAVAVLFLPLFRKTRDALLTASSLISFSRIVSIAFGFVGITGAYIIWLHLKDPQFIFTTKWGSRFIILSAFAALLFLARLYHQFLVDRSALKLCAGEGDGRVRRMVSWLGFTLPLEMFLGLAVLATTSLTIITTPPYPGEQFAFERHAISQGAEILMAVHPYEPKNFLITVRDEKTKRELAIHDIVVTLTNEEKSIGPIIADTQERFPGGYTLARSSLSPVGNWKVGIAAQRVRAYDAVAAFSLNYPNEVEASRIDPDKRTFGSFEILIIFATFGIIALSFLLYRFSKNLQQVCNDLGGKESSNAASFDGFLQPSRSWIFGFVGFALITLILYGANEELFKTDFQKPCERNGHFWLQSVPIKNGVALSSNTFTGCMLNVGLYHFVDAREYRHFLRPTEAIAELEVNPKEPIAGAQTNLAVSLNEIKEGRKIRPVQELTIKHDRIIHMLIIGEDLETFAHIHAEDLGRITPEMLHNAKFPFAYTFPKAGRYTILVDYVVRSRQFSEQFFVNVGGEPKMERAQVNLSREKTFDGYRVTFSAPQNIRAGKEVKLSYNIEKDGKPVRNLEPYLAASMHLSISNCPKITSL